MKNKLITKMVAVLLAVLMLVPLAGCDNGTETPTPPTGPAEYTVIVSDHSGNVPEFNVLVEFFDQSGERLSMKRIDSEGKVKIELERGSYTFVVKSNETLYYDESECVLTAEKLTAEVKLYTTPEDSYTIYPPFSDENGEESRATPYEAMIIGVGASYVEIDRTDMAYFIFNAEQGGMYRVSVTDKSIDLGYYGNPHAVQDIKLLETADGAFEIPIYDSSIGSETSAMIVIGLSSATAKNAVIVIERIGDIPPGPPETMLAAKELPKDFDKVDYLNHRLVNVSVTDRNAKVVFNEADGYYHYGTENGPIVYVRIASASPYGLAALSEIETRLWKNIYDDDGEVSERIIYNQMIKSYEAVCDENGICPLTSEVVEMIKSVGEQLGWWDFENSGRNIFMYDSDGNLTDINELTIAKGNEWMFPLCYVEEFVYGEESPIRVNPVEEKNYSVMVRENGAVSFVSEKAATLVIENASGITVTYGGKAYTAGQDGIIRVMLRANDLAFSLSGPDRATVSFAFEQVATYLSPVANAEFSVVVKTDAPVAIVLEKNATLVIEDADGLTVIYGDQRVTAGADGRLTLDITESNLEFVIETNENKNITFTFTDVGGK